MQLISLTPSFLFPQATYAYMKAAYLSMLTADDCLTFGETAYTLFRYCINSKLRHVCIL